MNLFSPWYNNPSNRNFLPLILGGLAMGAGGALAGGLLGGGGGGGGAPPIPQLDPMGKEFQGELYSTITGGLRGEGLTPQITGRSLRDLLAATKGGYQEAHEDLGSLMNRSVPRADIDVRTYLSDALNAEYARQRQSVEDEYALRPFEDISTAQNLAFGALGGEKRMGVGITNAYNQSVLQNMYQPTFSSALAGGLGGAAGMLLAGPIGYGKSFSSLG